MIRELQLFPAETLKYVLPISLQARNSVCQALKWDCALPLINLILHEASRGRDRSSFGNRDIPNGVVNLSEGFSRRGR